MRKSSKIIIGSVAGFAALMTAVANSSEVQMGAVTAAPKASATASVAAPKAAPAPAPDQTSAYCQNVLSTIEIMRDGMMGAGDVWQTMGEWTGVAIAIRARLSAYEGVSGSVTRAAGKVGSTGDDITEAAQAGDLAGATAAYETLPGKMQGFLAACS